MRTASQLLSYVALTTALVAPARLLAAGPAAESSAALPLIPMPEPIPDAAMSVDALRGDMRRYFREEKRGGAVLMGIGAPAAAIGGGLLAQDRDVLRGLAYPLLVMGALEFFGGLIFYSRSNGQVAKLDAGFVSEPWATRNLELKRIRRVNLQFSLIEGLEMTLLVGGVVMAAAGSGVRNETLTGVGLGLSLESAGLLIFDLYAGRRALRWTRSLERFASPVAAGP